MRSTHRHQRLVTKPRNDETTKTMKHGTQRCFVVSCFRVRWDDAVVWSDHSLANRPPACHTTRIMRRIVMSVAAATLLLFTGGARAPQASGDGPSDMTLIDDLLAEDCIDDVAQAGAPTARNLRG